MNDILQTVVHGASVLCNYFCKLQELENERFRIAAEYDTMNRKIDVTERVALERLENQKLVLQKSMAMISKELDGLSLSREILFRALEKLVHNVISDINIESKEISLRAIEFIRDEIQKVREDTNIQFSQIAANVMAALENPLNRKFIEGDEYDYNIK